MDEQSMLSLEQEIESAEDVISKLKKFTEELNNSGNNILTHLCSGLETFLGFDPSSKGYDGTGIVYSDLDRLCDGVMAFLSGVLESVKNEDEVTTYDNYIENTENKLNKVLEKLTKNIGTGRAGLAASVGAVKGWLEGYGKKVETLTNEVTSKLGELSGKLSSGAGKYYTEVSSQASSSLADQLSEWTKTVKKIERDVENINRDVNVLDDRLRDNVMREMKVVASAVKMLRDSAEVQGFREQVIKVDWELGAKKADVVRDIETKCEELEWTIQGNINAIDSNIGGIESLQTGSLQRLLKSIMTVDKNVKKSNEVAGTLDKLYHSQLLHELGIVEHAVDDLNTKNVADQLNAVFSEVSAELLTLGRQLETLKLAAENVKATVKMNLPQIKSELVDDIYHLKNHIISLIGNYIKTYVGLVKNKVSEIKLAMEVVNPKDTTTVGRSQLYTLVLSIRDRLRSLDNELNKGATAMGSTISSAVDGVTKALSELDTHVKQDLKGLEHKILEDLKTYVKQYVRAVKEKVGSIKGADGTELGLQCIVKKVINYVKTFDNFQSVLTDWIKDAVKLDAVNGYIYMYITNNKKHMQIDELTNVKQKVEQRITAELSSMVAEHKGTLNPTGSVADKLKSIGTFLNNFKALKSSAKVSKIVSSIESEVVKPLEQSETSKSDLNTAIRVVLHTISTAVESLGKEIAKVATDCHMANIDEAVKEAEDLETNLGLALGGVSTSLPPLPDGEVKAQIDDKITKTVAEAIKSPNKILASALSGAEAYDLTKAMPTYNTHVNTDTENTLRTKIGQIKEELKVFFEEGVKRNDSKFILLKAGRFGGYYTTKQSALSAIDQVLSKVESLQKVYPNVETLNDNLVKAITATGSDTTDEVTIGDNIYSKIKANVDAADPQLDSLLKDTTERGINMLHDVISDIQMHIAGVENKIRPQIDKLQKSGDIGIQVQDLQDRIQSVQNSVDGVHNKAKGQIRILVRDLRDQVTRLMDNIDVINNDIQYFNGALKQAIEDARASIQECKVSLTANVAKMKAALTEAAQKAFDDVYREVKQMFANQHKADLTALQKLLNEQKDAIQKIIDDGVSNGLRGLVRKMKGEVKENALNSENIDKLNGLATQLSSSTLDKKDAFERVCIALLRYITRIMDYMTQQVKNNSAIKRDVKSISLLSISLLDGLYASKHFDHTFSKNIYNLNTKVTTFAPKRYEKYDYPELAEILRNGMMGVTDQLDKAYVSRYSCQLPQPGDSSKYAKIFVTISTLLHDRFVDLYEICCNTPNAIKINKAGKHKLGPFFSQQGYAVATTDGIQNGELQNSSNMDCETTKSLLLTAIEGSEMEMLVAGKRTSDISVLHLNQYLYTVFGQYFQVCHFRIPSKSKYPCTVRDMLSWICGLQYTAVVENVKQHCATLLDNERKDAEKKGQKPDSVICGILENELLVQLSYTCRNAYGILVTIQGHGSGFNQADYPYACNFRDNSRGFHYPSDVPGLFDMLADVCARLLSALYLLYSRCRTPFKYLGWYECPYGKEIQASNWRCKDHSNTEPNDKPNTKPNCQPKSPLQSHLMDGLPGCLPHKLTSVGCKSECLTCPKSPRGQPCMTPMGFWDLTDAASINNQGKQLCKVLYEFCGNADSDLARLLRYLKSLSPSPPKTLGDMMSLYCQILRQHNGNYINNAELETHLKTATLPACFPLPTSLHGNYPVDRLVGALQKVYHSESDHRQPPIKDAITPGHKDLFSLVTKYSCESPNLCAPYLHPLCKNAYHTYPQKHAALYASWLIQLAWDLWSQLDSLLNAFKHMSCKAYGCPCNCAPGKHGVCEEDIAKSQIHPTSCKTGCHCPSIARCQGVLSLFYQYGFTFRVTKDLIENETKRTCDDFVKQMTKVLYDGYFGALFDEIDKFIFAIREPFIWLNVALWLLSFLYLIIVMVGRLDVLHIRSHLRIPSSHRITAQSLLAAAQVGRLAKISYLQP